MTRTAGALDYDPVIIIIITSFGSFVSTPYEETFGSGNDMRNAVGSSRKGFRSGLCADRKHSFSHTCSLLVVKTVCSGRGNHSCSKRNSNVVPWTAMFTCKPFRGFSGAAAVSDSDYAALNGSLVIMNWQ
jgi:hypothetical protein